MNQNPLTQFGNSQQRLEAGLAALRRGLGILVADDEDRENEVDLIFAAHSLTVEQMAMLIRECSGIVCLCLPPKKVDALGLPPMVENNSSPYQTAFTISIEAAAGVTTGYRPKTESLLFKPPLPKGGSRRFKLSGTCIPFTGKAWRCD